MCIEIFFPHMLCLLREPVRLFESLFQWGFLLYRNLSIDLDYESVESFLYGVGY